MGPLLKLSRTVISFSAGSSVLLHRMAPHFGEAAMRESTGVSYRTKYGECIGVRDLNIPMTLLFRHRQRNESPALPNSH